jgi:Serine hydrolase (FSH1)/Rhodanase C-terminal
LRSHSRRLEAGNSGLAHAGGIVRYLEAFPSGGYFEGKNFVFDERVSHAAEHSPAAVVGRCLLCSAPHDDYSSRHRCAHCRLLVLVCHECSWQRQATPKHSTMQCQAADTATGGSAPQTLQTANGAPRAEQDVTGQADDTSHAEAAHQPNAHVLCELCQAATAAKQASCHARPSLPAQMPEAPLHVLALHGFRENGSRFRGRLRALMKRLRGNVRFTFIDAPHMLSPAPAGLCGAQGGCSSAASAPCDECAAIQQGLTMHASDGQKAVLAPAKFGWLVAPSNTSTNMASLPLKDQLQRQTEGWQASVAAVQRAVDTHGPFDGCLAFSQGCALATLAIALQELRASEPWAAEPGNATACLAARARAPLMTDAVQCSWHFGFVMLCSGHLGVCEPLRRTINSAAPLATPSLHVFGAAGKDAQVAQAHSEALVECFAQPEVRRHGVGHVIPSTKADTGAYLSFFQRALQAEAGT